MRREPYGSVSPTPGPQLLELRGVSPRDREGRCPPLPFFTERWGCLVGREVEVLRSNILRIIEDESFLEELRKEFKIYFDTANKFIEQYYRENCRLPSVLEVYRVLRRNSAFSVISSEVARKVLEAWKSYIELKKRGYKVEKPEFRRPSIILHNQQYRIYAKRESDGWSVEKIEVRLNRKWISIKARGKLRRIPVLESGLVFYINIDRKLVYLRRYLTDKYLILGEYCTNKNKARFFREIISGILFLVFL